MADKNEILGAIGQTLDEVREILAKSGYSMDMNKAEPEAEPTPQPEEQPSEDSLQDEAAAQAPAAEGAEGDAPAPEGSQQAAAEGPEVHAEAGHDAMLAEAQALSDEELDKLLEVLMAEKEGRGAQGAPGQEAPSPEGEAAPAPAPEMAEKSMKEEYAKMAKSMDTVLDAIGKLSKEVSDMKTVKAAPAPKTVTKAVVTNKQQVLEKSTPVKQRLGKSESLQFLEGELRKRNPIVNSELVAEMNLARSQDEINTIQDRLAISGLSFPTK